MKGILFIGLLMLAGCTSSAAIESFVSPDPQLSAQQLKPEQPSASQSQPSQTKSATQGNKPTGQNQAPEAVTSQNPQLPSNFPASFPLYPQAQLQEIKPGKNNTSGTLTWNTADNRQALVDYYQKQLPANDWQIIKPFNYNPQQSVTRAIAIKNKQRVDLTLLQPTNSQNTDNQNTKLSVIYQPLEQASAESSISQTFKSNPQSQSSSKLSTKNPIGINVPNSNDSQITNLDFTDLDEVSEQLRQPLKSVAALGILTPYTGNGNTDVSKFAPNQIITRGEYANWLLAANNRYYKDDPGKKILLATKTSEPAFPDVKINSPNFGAIQGLAEAGLVPSRLTEDSTNLLFRPNAPLTREDLLAWKVPLDMRQALPQASIKALEESWGFQDAADINSTALRALYGDFQNGDRSNVRRIFGYTTLFQPKKPVTRAEAAVSLWYFGYQGDGITAREILATDPESNS
ncbi:MAG: S-layer homology domain-containing protein [Waterburya sp.]